MNNEEKILGLLENMNGRFDAIENRLDKIDGRLDKVDGRLDKVEGDIADLKKTVERGFRETREVVFEVVEVVGAKIDRLEATVKDDRNVLDQNTYELQILKKKA